jgi:Two-component sensor kinase N-terminal
MMPRQTTSIKRDILLGAIALLAILGIGLFLYVRNFSLNAADTAFDRVLAASALSIADSIRVEDGHLTLEMPLAALEILGAARDNRAFYAVRAPDHSLVTGYPDLPDEPRGLNDHSPHFFRCNLFKRSRSRRLHPAVYRFRRAFRLGQRNRGRDA